MDPFLMEEAWSVDAVMQMFESSGVTHTFSINQSKLANWVVTVKAAYLRQNMFHNWVHAWSVTCNAYLMVMDPDVIAIQGPLERLSILIACLCHDMNHPGVNSEFLIKSASPLALKYPQANCLEAFHLDQCMCLLAPGCKTDILEGLDEDKRKV